METLEDMIQHPEELEIEGLCSPLASQILDFGDEDAELFAETLRNSDASSSSVNGGYDDTSAFSPFPSMDLAALSSLLDAGPSPKLDPDIASAFAQPYPAPPVLLHVPPYHQDVPFDVIGGELSAYSVYEGEQCLPPPSLVDLGIGALYAAGGGGMSLPAYGEGGAGLFHAGVMVNQRAVMGEYERAEGGGVGMYMPEQLMHRGGYNSGDMQVLSGESQQMVHGCGSPTTLVSDIAALDDSSINKVGRLSAEERKEKIQRYMKKRNHRNFTKKIKYACRKTLADSRPRVRGRFAKNDELGEVTTPSSNGGHEFDDDGEVVGKEVDEMLDSSDILAHISGLNSFKYNYCPESWT